MTLLTKELPFITKVLIPRRRDYILHRVRLLKSMKAGLHKKVQVICAPAGYGKTALLVEFASELDLPVCWYSFAPEDHDPITLLRYCLHSIRTRFVDFGNDYRSLLRDSIGADWHTQVGFFISALHSDITGQLVLVFDDLWIHGKKELEEALSLLIHRAPENIHFILSSRGWPSLPCLPKLNTENELNSLHARDLSFSTEETVQLLTRLWERPVTRKEAEEVNRQTGGWAAAIFLTAKVQTGDEIQYTAKPRDERALFDYLSEEVFDKLPDALQHFLLQTSVLREFTVELCDRVLDISSSEELISQVKDRGLFLEERAGAGTPYKYHDLFREYLASRLRFEYPEEYKRLNQRAATLYSELEEYDAAIYHFLSGGEPNKAVELLKQVAGAYFDQGRWQKLDSWLAHFPKETIEGEPDLLLLSGQVLLRLGNPTGSLEQLDKLVTGPHANNREVVGKALVAKSTAYRRLGHLDLAVTVVEEGLSILRGLNCSRDDIAEAHKQLSNAFNTKGEYDRAEQNLRTALALVSKENLRLFSLICNDLGATYFGLGELDQAAMHFEQARAGLLKLGSEGPMAEAMINLALVYYHKGEFDLALDEVGEALKVAQGAVYPRVVATALMNQAMIQRALGAYANSLSTATRALELARQLLDHRLIAESTEDLGSAYRKLGETSKAEVLLNQALLEVEDSGEKYVTAIYHISLGKLYCQTSSYGPALENLRLAEEQLRGLKNLRRVAETKLYQAAIHYRTNKLKNALKCLSHVSDLVSQLGYDGFLLADGDEVIDVLRFGAAKRLGDGVFTRLIKQLTQGPMPEERSNGSLPREVSVAGLPTIRAFGFGNPHVILDTHEVMDVEWRSRKAKELFFFMLSNKRPLRSEEIGDALWPQASLDVSANSVKRNIYLLRQALFFDCVLARESGYCMNPEVPMEFDLERFLLHLKLANDPGQGHEAQEAHLYDAIGYYQGPFLNGFYSEWCQELRTELEFKYHAALMTLASYHASRGKFHEAVELLGKVVAADPYNEEAQYQLIESYIKGNQPFIALQQLRRYAKLCLEELGVDLPQRFLHYHRRILRIIPNSA